MDDEEARLVFDLQVAELMMEEKSAGGNPYDVLKGMKLIGYGPEDVYRVAVFYHSLLTSQEAVVSGATEYLQSGGAA